MATGTYSGGGVYNTSRRSIGGSFATTGYDVAATLTTALSGSNNDLTYTAKSASAGSNDVSVTYVVAGNSTPLSVSVSTNDITVNVATNGGGAATSTAAQVKTAVDGSAPAAALVSVANAPDNDGTGVVTALSKTNLSGGTTQSKGRGGNNFRATRVKQGSSYN